MTEAHLWPLAWEALQALTAHYGPAINGQAEAAGIPRGEWYGWLMAAHLFDPEPVSAQTLAVRSAYTSLARLESHLAQGAGLGLLEADGGTYRLTAAGRAAVGRMIESAYAAMSPLQPLPDAELARLADLLSRLVQASLIHPAPPDPWCLRVARRYDPGSGAAALVRIDQHLSDLAAYRDDAHLAAWRPLGVKGPAWEAFTLLWRCQASSVSELLLHLAHRGHDKRVYVAALDDLAGRGWVETRGAEWRVTELGAQVRQDAETLTDRYFYAAWTCLDQAEPAELQRLLTGLRKGLDRLRGQADDAS